MSTSAIARLRKARLPKALVAVGAALTLTFVTAGVAGADQNVKVKSSGTAVANSGFNLAVGNVSQNKAKNNQTAKAKGKKGDKLAVNIGGASNDSDGSAEIDTGDAEASNENNTIVLQFDD